MERCFIIEENADLHKKYFDYKQLQEENEKVVKDFILKNIKDDLTKTSFAIFSDALGVTLSNDDFKKFKNQLKAAHLGASKNGIIYIFKKNSTIGKKYKELGIKAACYPSIGFELDQCYFKARSRMFDHNGIVYVSLDSIELGKDDPMPQGWREIGKFEFYGVIEEIENEVKE